jgi:hypothetical protein
MFGLQPDGQELANISTKMLTDFASPKETSAMLMHIMKAGGRGGTGGDGGILSHRSRLRF